MKSDKKMTEDILIKVSQTEQRKKQQKKTATKTLGSFFAFALILFIGLSFFNNSTVTPPGKESDTTIENSTQKTADKAFSLIVANAAEEKTTVFHKENNITIPLGGILLVKNTENMSDVNRIDYELKLKLQELYGKTSGWHIHGETGETAVYFGTMDSLALSIDDPDSVESITLSCTDNGEITIRDKVDGINLENFVKSIKQGQNITVTGEEYENIYGKDGKMAIYWFVSEELKETLKNAPDTPLSTVSDTITGVISYIDGTKETFTISLNFNDNGELSAVYSHSFT